MPEAELTARLEVLPGQWLMTWDAGHVAGAARPGNFVHLREPSTAWPVPRHVLPVNTIDRVSGQVSLHVRAGHPAARWLATLAPGRRVPMGRPMGRGLQVDPRSRHLLLAAPAGAMPWLRALVDEGLAGGRQVVVLTSAPDAAGVYPSSLLPDEVEYGVATDDGSLGHHGSLGGLVRAHEAWADQCFVAGSRSLLADLVALARGRDARLGVARLGRRGGTRSEPGGSSSVRRRSWLQVLLEHEIGCALGTCLGCVVPGVAGPVRVCREGPAFAPDELDWEAPG